MRCPQFTHVVVAVDSEEVAALCQREGWQWQSTDPALPSGTDRMHAVAQQVAADIYVNVQGDEPLLQPTHIDALLRPFLLGPHVDVTTIKTPCTDENVANPNAVKVVTGGDGRALYFSRSPVPFVRDAEPDFAARPARFLQHVGIYAYRRDFLLKIATEPPHPLEESEKLEQLRVLGTGGTIAVGQIAEAHRGVDTAADYAEFVRWFRESGTRRAA